MIDVFGDQEGSQFTAADWDRVLRSTFVRQVEFHREIRSTNDRALELARQAGRQYPLLVLAEEQIAGRGRGANRWWAGRGALTFSLLLETQALDLPPRRWPQASLTAGLAVSEAIETMLADRCVQLKWPNDVYVRGRKACGILVEVPPRGDGRVVVGIGINVNNSLREAPPELQATATALCDAAQREFAVIEVLEQVLVRLAERLQGIGRQDEELRNRWRERCLLTGRDVQVKLGGRTVEGTCRGIDEEGALVVDTAHGVERCLAGVVTRF